MKFLEDLFPALVFIAMILVIWIMNSDAEQRLQDCEKLQNAREIEYCKMSYMKGI